MMRREDFLGFNLFDEKWWFNKESMEVLVSWICLAMVPDALQGASCCTAKKTLEDHPVPPRTSSGSYRHRNRLQSGPTLEHYEVRLITRDRALTALYRDKVFGSG